MAARGKQKKTRPPSARSRTRWSARVTHESNALDLRKNVFALNSPRAIAVSLKHSAEKSRRRKSGAYQSAMAMLTFYINRGGKTLSRSRKQTLERAKTELRKQFGRE
jgi:hypothetical protein